MKINKQFTILRRSVIIIDFMDANLSLYDAGIMKLKRNEQSTSHLRSKIFSKQLHPELRKNG
jgi:hypothetical protein